MQTSINVVPSKNQALCECYIHETLLILYICSLLLFFIKSREKELITKERIVMHSH